MVGYRNWNGIILSYIFRYPAIYGGSVQIKNFG